MANPFYVDPTAGIDRGAMIGQLGKSLAGLGSVLGDRRNQELAQAKLAEGKMAMQSAFDSGDPNAIADVMIQYPEMSQTAQNAMQFKNDATRENMIGSAREITINPSGAEEVLTKRIQMLSDRGVDPTETILALKEYQENPEGFLANARNTFAIYDPKGFQSYQSAQLENEKYVNKQMGTGSMSGYTFDPSTGKYTIQKDIKDQLTAKADMEAREAEEKSGKVDIKTRQSINKDFTSLIKDSVSINKAAKDLDKLKATSSPTDQLAAIFKFMKSLDPASVVREGEQQMAQTTGGPADFLVGYVNQIKGDGKLTDIAFSNMVNTAKNLSDSAVDVAKSESSDWLNVYGDTLPAKMRASLEKRIPARFERVKPMVVDNTPDQTVEPAQPTEKQAPQAALQYLQRNPQMAEQFKSKYGYLPEGM